MEALLMTDLEKLERETAIAEYQTDNFSFDPDEEEPEDEANA